MTLRKSACRLCAGQCAVDVTFDSAGRIDKIRGDQTDPVSRGFACIKGLTLGEAHHSDRRLLRPLRRNNSGSFDEVDLDEALDGIAFRLARIVEEHGPEAVSAFKGTMNYTNFITSQLLPAFLHSLGSNAFYSTMTIDQSAKWVTAERLGVWGGGKDPFASADVLMMVGTNPLVSLATFNFALQNPVKQMREAKAGGMKIIVIDPRRTETAVHADLHLQPLPGEDCQILAAILNVILDHGWHDAQFCDGHADGLAELRAAIARFTPEYVAARADVPVEQIHAAAAMFAQPISTPDGWRRRRGTVASGVGPNMAAHGNLAEHLVEALNVVCGRFAREGETVPNPGVIGARREWRAQAYAPKRSWEEGEGRSPSGYGRLFGERMTGGLADDILCDAPNRVRAMIVDGGNPALAVPGTGRVDEAFGALDLLVTIDPFLSRTASLSHYVLPPKMLFERYEIGNRDYESFTNFRPYAKFTPPIMPPPAGSDIVDDWVYLWEIASRMGVAIELEGTRLDMNTRPTDEALFRILLHNSAVGFEELTQDAVGKVYPAPPLSVQGPDQYAGRFQLAPDDVIAELAGLPSAATKSTGVANAEFPFRLVGRRMREVQNTMYHHLPSIHQRVPFNPVSLHPDDLAMVGVTDGAHVRVRSAEGEVNATAQADATLRRGVVTMSHGWDQPTSAGAKGQTSNVNVLTSITRNRDPLNAMPVMTAFAVSITPEPK